ncbi:hypothetical protein DPMN_036114 [Dreissena polymorpha]|uniref:Uncharacterized protein n=2 Tax=Dreissena polymorpha TaxID=45954 RepID=A0A9D4MD28_DREPO|nr:hypothetical protein DPMN_036114 [Dreissena polymorpha]
MLAQDNTMKLRLRTALFVCGSLSFCAICLTLSRLPTLHDRKSSFLPNSDTRQIGVYDDNGEFPHIFTFRKRLNKSNYSSDNISPEMAKRALEIKSLANDTNEDMKYQSDSVNQEVVHETHQVHKMLNSQESHEKNLEFNFSSSTVDLMLNKLQTSNGLKFNFEKTRLVSYTNFLKLQTHRFRRKGMGLPIYENYNGG